MYKKLAAAIHKVQVSENTACYYDGAEGTRTEADNALKEALQLAGKLAVDLSTLREAVQRAARELSGLSSVYTVGAGNEMHVLNLVYSDASAVADKLSRIAQSD
ncbi:hypothetical protein [Amycolatopsis magusensis]|uniref:hypothetical protein n=1 Tax=Amycolatopsis magusensis TaxID=882444 RepID=UPI0037917551